MRNRDGIIVGCSCPAFTSEEAELITAYDLLEEYNLTQQEDVYEQIIIRACEYGLEEDRARKYMDIQTLVDYLITNRDRHQGNIGFLRDPDSLHIISPSPVFDSGSSKEKEFEKPEGVYLTTVNGLYPTETECIKHIKNVEAIPCNKLPSDECIYEELKKSSSLSEYRIEMLTKLYSNKVKYLKELQNSVQ